MVVFFILVAAALPGAQSQDVQGARTHSLTAFATWKQSAPRCKNVLLPQLLKPSTDLAAPCLRLLHAVSYPHFYRSRPIATQGSAGYILKVRDDTDTKGRSLATEDEGPHHPAERYVCLLYTSPSPRDS